MLDTLLPKCHLCRFQKSEIILTIGKKLITSRISETWHIFEGRKNLDYTGKHLKGQGIFWIYGDSLSYYFYESFSETRRQFCETYFTMCNASYNWIYPKTLYELVCSFLLEYSGCNVVWYGRGAVRLAIVWFRMVWHIAHIVGMAWH